MQLLRCTVGVLLVVHMGVAHVAQADQIDDANRKLINLEENARQLGAEFRDSPAPLPNAAERRYIDAELLFTLKNYEEAATILLDVIETYPNSRAYDDALVLLGESLYLARDLSASRHYFEMAIQKNTGSRKEQTALQRLVEIALKTNDFDHVDEYLKRLESIPADRLEPSVPYTRGKYLFFRDKLDEALSNFQSLPASNPYYLQALYLIGTVQVKKGDLAAATTAFDAVLRVQPKSEDDKEIQQLAKMALGRLYYERGQFDKAKEAYGSIDRNSKYFSDALYEQTWTLIKAKDFVNAYRSLDLMLLQDPDSPRSPELRILRGNLHLRLANFYLASENFTQTRDEFEPIYGQLKTNLDKSKTDPKYFDQLLSKGMAKFDITAFVPVPAVKWVKGEPDVARMLTLADDVGTLQKDLKDSEQTLARLEKAVTGAGKVGIFPDLASVRAKSTEIQNQTMDVRRKYNGKIRDILGTNLDAGDKSALDRIEGERASLDQQVSAMPLTTDAMQKRERSAKDSLREIDQRASELNVQIHAMEAELVAIEQYYMRSRAEQKIQPADLEQPVKDLHFVIDEARTALDKSRNDIEEARREFGAGGAVASTERDASARLGDLMKREMEVFQRARSRLASGDQRDFDRISELLQRADGVHARVKEVDGRLDAAAEQRLGKIRERISTEKTELLSANQKLTGVMSESQNVGGGLAQVMIAKVTDRFYDLVVQSDVGLVDVSWGLKDQKTTTLSKLINQQKLELKSVEDDFRSLLEEEK